MERQEIFKTLAAYKKDLESKGYKVIYIGLYGSQNYNVDDEKSDIDARAIVMPSLHDIIFRKPTSKVYEYDTGAVDVKDIITYYDVIKKGNLAFIEPIDTEYSIGDKYIKELFSRFRPNLKAVLGMMYEKRKALTHEYPSKHEEFAKWGYDPKQYHHIKRLEDIFFHIIRTGEQVSYLKYERMSSRMMISIKRNTSNNTKEFAEKQSDEIINRVKEYFPKDYKYEPINIDDEINAYIEKEIKKDMFKNPYQYVREIRTFDNPIPSKDLAKFPILEQYKGKDISYIVYESIDIL